MADRGVPEESTAPPEPEPCEHTEHAIRGVSFVGRLPDDPDKWERCSARMKAYLDGWRG